jgi:hypothetical protein
MKAVFTAMEEHSSPLDGATVHNKREVMAVLNGARGREPFGCELEGDDGFRLTLGICLTLELTSELAAYGGAQPCGVLGGDLRLRR